MLSDRQIGLYSLCYIELIGFSIHVTTEDVYKLFGKFKVCTFEAHVLSWRPVKNETKVDMNNVAPVINHDVTVVTILNLEYVAYHGIRRETLNKIQSC
jgi:hypothetical protein